jgi:hypothetical protein
VRAPADGGRRRAQEHPAGCARQGGPGQGAQGTRPALQVRAVGVAVAGWYRWNRRNEGFRMVLIWRSGSGCGGGGGGLCRGLNFGFFYFWFFFVLRNLAQLYRWVAVAVGGSVWCRWIARRKGFRMVVESWCGCGGGGGSGYNYYNIHYEN